MKLSGYIKRGLLIGAVLALALGLRYTVGKIDLTYIKAHHAQLIQFVHTHYFFSVLFYLLLYITMVLCMIPVTVALTILSGHLFGGWWGGIYSIAGSTLSALCAYYIYRYFFGAWAQKKCAHIKKFAQEFQRSGPWYILSLHLIPLTPFGLINILTACSSLSLFSIAWATAGGVLPATFLYAYAGHRFFQVQSLHDILSPSMILLLCSLSAFALIPVIIRYKKRHLPYDY